METPYISIIVITYNQESCLPTTLDSLLDQNVDYPYEIIVADDCSTDSTRTVISRYAADNDCIRPIYNERNLGLVGNYINAVSYCKGKYLAMCDGDDVWNDASKLQKQVDILENDSSIGLVYTDVIINSVITGERYVRKCHEPQENLFSQLLRGNFLTISTVCFRADLLKYVDFDSFVAKGYRMQDYPIWLSISNFTRFYHIPVPMVTYLIDHKVINTGDVSLHACRFDENTTCIRLDFLNKYPDKTDVTEAEILDAHYCIGYRSGLNTADRLRTLEYVKQINNKTPYHKRLAIICRSKILFSLYMKYRSKALMKSQLDMYFGN